MKFWVGVTDNDWFEFLRQRQPDEVNFWRPSGTHQFRAIDPGGLFLFKLHSPLNFIVGGGFFVRHSILPLSLAWKAFDEKNGASDVGSLLSHILKYRKDQSPDPSIGCTILAEPFFMDETDWIEIPPDWSKNLVQGRTYDSEKSHGRDLWDAVMERLSRRHILSLDEKGRSADLEESRFGAEYLTRARLGQGAFRVLVTEAYHRRCGITGERTLPVLEAAHIRPFGMEGPNRIDNGLCLRSDLHILFDRGYLTINDDFKVEVSGRIRDEFENGRDYYAFAGRQMQVLPECEDQWPFREFVEWHNNNVFIA